MTDTTNRRRTWRARRPLAAAVVAVLTAAGSAVASPQAARASGPAEAGTIATVAGDGVYGFAGDGGPATSARLFHPRAIAFDASGNTYIADAMNGRVRRIDRTGAITTIAGNGVEGFGGDGGSALQASLNQPHGLAVDAEGNLYIADSGNHRLRRVDAHGVITTVAGNGTPGMGGDGGPASAALLKQPKTLTIDEHGRLLMADSGNNRVRRIDLATGIITTVAGVTASGFSGDGGQATRARLDSPGGVAVTRDGTVYIADTDNERVRKITPDGVITTIAGTGTAGYGGDGGPATQATLNMPRAVAVDVAGDVYIGEEDGQRIRRIDGYGTITTIAGNGVGGFAGEGAPAGQAQLDRLRAVNLDAAGNLWIADTFNNRVRVIYSVSAAGAGTAGADPWTPPAPRRSGYWMLGSDGRVYPFGDATTLGDPSAALPAGAEAVTIEPTPSYDGYWILDSRGHVFTFGDATAYGNVPSSALGAGETVMSVSATPTGKGYWLFTSHGRVFPFGDATFLGDMAGVALNGPVLHSTATPSGHGYYMVASDGGVFTFGDARFFGSMGATPLNAPVQGLVPSTGGAGYWLVASDGGIFAFGDAPFRGSMGDTLLNKPVVGMVRFGAGYLMVAADGGIFNFSDRPFSGSLGDRPPSRPVVAVATLDA